VEEGNTTSNTSKNSSNATQPEPTHPQDNTTSKTDNATESEKPDNATKSEKGNTTSENASNATKSETPNPEDNSTSKQTGNISNTTEPETTSSKAKGKDKAKDKGKGKGKGKGKDDTASPQGEGEDDQSPFYDEESNVTDAEGEDDYNDVDQVITTIKPSDTTSTTTTTITTTTTVTTTTVTTSYAEQASGYSFGALGAGACSAHFVSKPLATDPEECARECYDDPACLVFSSGSSHCALGCRISSLGNNAGEIPEQSDGQCYVDTMESDCSFYKLSFFHEETRHLSCGFHYQERTDADTLARCAHECKDHANCMQFSYGDGCETGCRISLCGENDGSAACPDDKQCSTVQASGDCALYVMEEH
jgi:hypothetical protein